MNTADRIGKQRTLTVGMAVEVLNLRVSSLEGNSTQVSREPLYIAIARWKEGNRSLLYGDRTKSLPAIRMPMTYKHYEALQEDFRTLESVARKIQGAANPPTAEEVRGVQRIASELVSNLDRVLKVADAERRTALQNRTNVLTALLIGAMSVLVLVGFGAVRRLYKETESLNSENQALTRKTKSVQEHGTMMLANLRQELNHVESRLREAEVVGLLRENAATRREQLFQQLPCPTLVCCPDGQVIEWNPAASALLGRSDHDILSIFLWDLVESDAEGDCALEADRLLRHQMTISRVSMVNPDGSRVWLTQWMQPMLCKNGRVVAMLVHLIPEDLHLQNQAAA